MKKRLISASLCLVMISGMLSVSGIQAFAAKEDDLPAIRLLSVDRELASIQAVDGVEQFSEHWFGDAATIKADLSKSPGLAYTLTFADNTKFPADDKLPAGYDPKELLEWGKYPGLNMDILHKHGFTGKGATIAYVDQPIAKHKQYSGSNIHYKNNTDSDTSMHGPAVLSLLAGKDIGTAPEAEIYFYGHASWKADQKTHAECLYQIIEQNKSLPDGKKIRMVGFSDNIDSSEANADVFSEAVKACEDAGIMVWFCGEYGPLSFIPLSDKNDPDNLVIESWWGSGNPSLVFVPAAGRTTAAAISGAKNIYWSEGGLSWTMPYVLGLYAIAIEIDPSLTQEALRKMIVDTAYVNASGMKIVDPVGFVAAALKGVGRDEEAQTMLDEVKARRKYLYAVMDTAAMSDEDLIAVADYLASITEMTVLIADAAKFADANSLYEALKKDAEERGGTVAGVQIFGTPSMVPSFTIKYKVQMEKEADEGGGLLTDLFYGNFENDSELLTRDYNVMDHMAEAWNVDLIPQWPVARLPLTKGEFKAFFEKYNTFVLDTGLERLEIVSFSNPIFPSKNHIDDMGLFLKNRVDKEFNMMDVPYRLYGNQKGQYPVNYKVLGGFEAENMTAENEKGFIEFIINTHGQRDNIDNAIFENDKEQRISLVNMKNINTVLGSNPYYLDAWTCLNGAEMANNLTTMALNGKCVGMFSATTIISNNGVNWNAPLKDMAKSNPFYFYYNYLKALHEGESRSRAFFIAQQEYGKALIKHSKEPLQLEGNYQFNLYNLLAYHNFGVTEPSSAALAMYDSKGYINQATKRVTKPVQTEQSAGQPNRTTIKLSDGKPIGEPKKVGSSKTDELKSGKLTVHSFTSQELDNGYTRFTIEYTAPEGLSIFVFDPPNGKDIAKKYDGVTTGEKSKLIFDLSEDEITSARSGITINFYTDDNNRFFVFVPAAQLK